MFFWGGGAAEARAPGGTRPLDRGAPVPADGAGVGLQVPLPHSDNSPGLDHIFRPIAAAAVAAAAAATAAAASGLRLRLGAVLRHRHARARPSSNGTPRRLGARHQFRIIMMRCDRSFGPHWRQGLQGCNALRALPGLGTARMNMLGDTAPGQLEPMLTWGGRPFYARSGFVHRDARRSLRLAARDRSLAYMYACSRT
eukprot:SAG22_NODE_3272_length_1816_cov_3.040186_2_plen_198_part_00